MIAFLLGAFKVIFLLSTLIILHEFGHFIVAKLCNMKVLKFSIGFGPKLFHKQIGETEYLIRLILLGGYVQLEGEDTDSNDERSFSKKPAWQRILVLLAGVTMNFVLAIIIYICIFMSINIYSVPKISAESDESKLASYGISVGEEIYKINGEKVYNADDVLRIVGRSKEDILNFEIYDKTSTLVKREITIPTKKIGYIGVVFEENRVYQILEDGAGAKSGLKVGDALVELNGESGDIYGFLSIIQTSPNQELNLKVIRDGEEVLISLTPDEISRRYFEVEFIEVKDQDFLHNLYYAWQEEKYNLKATFVGFADLVLGRAENVEVQGIVGISKQISSTKSALEFFYLMSAISLSLAIMNLLPIPGLDGGKILITLIEIIRRKPMKKETEAKITLIGFMLLLLLVIVITAKDISNL